MRNKSTEAGATDYTRCPLSPAEHILNGVLAMVGGFLVGFIFYRSVLLSLIAGLVAVPAIVALLAGRATKKRLLNLRGQFRDMLESMNVAMRAGSTEIRALESSRDDLKMLYSEQSDIVREVDYILAAYNNGGIPLRKLFRDFADRSGLEDVESFASIYEVIEGKSSRSSEILRQTQQVITDKMEIEAEIETMITSTKSEQTMMLIMPFFSIYIGFTMPASISIYWIAQGLLGIVQEWVLTKHFRKVYDAEDVIRRQRAAEQAAIEAERERIRAERRAKNPDGITANTSKKKIKAKEKAERGPVIEGKLTPEERAALKEKKAAATGGDPNRPYCRGRAYEPNRYAKDGTELIAAETEEVVDDYVEPEEAPEIIDDYVEETAGNDEAAEAEEAEAAAETEEPEESEETDDSETTE